MRQPESNDDQVFITRAKNGDMSAFETLVRKYQKPVYRLCRRMTGVHQSADDLVQDTFLKAYVSLHSFKDGMDFYSWIRKIAVNSSLNYLKKRRREEPLGAKDMSVAGNPRSIDQELPHEKLQRHQLEQKFRAALMALPADHRIVFLLRVYEDQSYKEIAEALGIPEGTVMSRLNRSRKKLKKMMAESL